MADALVEAGADAFRETLQKRKRGKPQAKARNGGGEGNGIAHHSSDVARAGAIATMTWDRPLQL